MSKASDPRHAGIDIEGNGFDAQAYEESNVHSVYECIAPHFSSTRYKPWPLIPAFLNSLPPGSIGADLGCGNGKYLSLRSTFIGDAAQAGIVGSNDILTIGLDRSSNLVNLAAHNVVIGERVLDDAGEKQRNEVMVGDAISSCYRSRCFDYALSIATIHHFSTKQRRVQAVQEIIRIIRPVSAKEVLTTNSKFDRSDDTLKISKDQSGRFLIYVWALEQKGESRRKFESIGKSKDEQGRDLLVPWVLNATTGDRTEGQMDTKVYQRFYHVFQQGELEKLVEEAASPMTDISVRLETSGWEKGNWYGIWQCIKV